LATYKSPLASNARPCGLTPTLANIVDVQVVLFPYDTVFGTGDQSIASNAVYAIVCCHHTGCCHQNNQFTLSRVTVFPSIVASPVPHTTTFKSSNHKVSACA
jgi:hypothetical protein